jgi:L,D-transpeptidase catalytic domain
MKQVSTQRCPRCQTAMGADQQFCSICSTNTETISYRAGEDPFQDDDRTVRASTRLSSRLYLKAVEQSPPPSQEPPRHDEAIAHAQDPVKKQPGKRVTKKRALLIFSAVGLLLLALLFFSEIASYNGTANARQQSAQAKAQLDNQLQHALDIGVPSSYLQPLFTQEEQVSGGSSLLTLLHNQLVAGYYQRQAIQYHALFTQVPAVITNATGQLQGQAQRDMQSFQTELINVNAQGIGNLQMFAQSLSQEQLQFAAARLPQDYVTLSQDARTSIQTLDLLTTTYQQLSDFSAILNKMKQAHQDVTLLQTMYQNDLQLFNSAAQASDFQNLGAQIDAQYQQVVANSLQQFQYIGATKLNELQMQVSQLKTYGVDTKSPQALLDAAQVALGRARTLSDDLAFFSTVDADIAALHAPLVRGQARYLLQQFHHEVAAWAQAHVYYDSYDGKDYALDNGYMSAGLGNLLDQDMAGAQTDADFETMVAEANNALFNLHMFETDYTDRTPYNQMHASDKQMLARYGLQKRQVLMVSLVEQVMRVYQSGKLVRSFTVTTGRQELPSIPGVWSVLERKSPIIFQSGEPRNSPYWFPDTPIHYAMLYHLGGYFVHDAPWREAFGPGTQFPHQDPIGTSAYNFDGSHGCINLSESDAGWVYTHTNWNTVIVIY